MIEKLKMCVAGIIFGKNLCLKSVTDTFFSNMWSVIKRGMGWDMKESLVVNSWNRLAMPELGITYIWNSNFI